MLLSASVNMISSAVMYPFIPVVRNGWALPSTTTSAVSSPGQRRKLLRSPMSSGDSALPVETPVEFKLPPAVMDADQIRRILPHRYPLLMVDRVVEFVPGVSVVAIKNVTITDHFFVGHFPDRPIMPGVLIIEAMAQVGGLVSLQLDRGRGQPPPQQYLTLAGVDKVRFRKMVVPGDTLVMRMNLVRKRFAAVKMEGKAYVGGEIVCQADFLVA